MLKLDWCSYKAAKYAVEHWHYSRCLPKFKQIWIGVWEDSDFIGMLSFGRSATPYLGDAYGLKTTECVELTRIALNKHKTPVSRIMSIAIKMLSRQSSGIRLIVSLADPLQGHYGGVYQATNWVYIGRSSGCKQFFWKGKWRNDTSMMRHLMKFPEDKRRLKSRKIEGKYKYLMPLDKDMKKRIEPLRQPYPKCVGSIDSDVPDIQSDKGGASPTSTLHSLEVSV